MRRVSTAVVLLALVAFPLVAQVRLRPTGLTTAPTGPAPDGFTVTGTPMIAHLSWNGGASRQKIARSRTSFVVYRADGPNANWIQRIPDGFTGGALDDTVPDPRITYRYRLVASYPDGTWGEALASFVSPPPVNPTGFRAVMTAPGAARLEWDAAPGAVQYRIDGAGVSNTGLYVTGVSTIISPLTPGALSWQIVALYPGSVADYTNRPKSTAMNRAVPAHAPAFLSKPNGPGSEAEATAHYSRLVPPGAPNSDHCTTIACVLSGWGVDRTIAYGGWTDQAVTYTNRTELGATRKTQCYFGSSRSAVICHSQSSRGISLIIMTPEGARFASFDSATDYAAGWGNDYRLSKTARFDAEGPKFVPHVCLACHGGHYDPATELVKDASLLPIDPSLVDFGPGRAAAEEPLRNLNGIIRQTYSSGPVAAYIQGLYGGNVDEPGAVAATDYVPPGWVTQPALYRDFVKKDCAMCHLAAAPQLSFFSAGDFLQNRQLIYTAVCQAHSMPHAEVPFTNFWNSGSGPVFGPGLFALALGFSNCQ